MTNPFRITAVSYANTFPFVYGIERSGMLPAYALSLKPPAQCAQSFAAGDCDVALIPVGALPALSDYEIITDMCIGAINDVKSVLLVSKLPLKEIKTIGLDMESATSVRLARVLAANLWDIAPEWQQVDVNKFAQHDALDAFVVIGDKAFDIAHHFPYKFDLAAEWKRLTELPFVFAVWVARPQTDPTHITNLTAALHYGIHHIDAVVKHYAGQSPNISDLKTYLTENINYDFDEKKKLSLQKFLTFVSKI